MRTATARFWCAILCVGAAACGDSSRPNAPSSPAPVGESSGPAAFGEASGPANFAACLASSREPGCFSAARFGPRSVSFATAPGAPGTLSAAVSGNAVALVWSAPASGDPPASYAIEAGAATGLADLANIATGSSVTTFSTSGVPAGTYFVRVRALNASGAGAASNEVVVVISASACTAAPNAPTGLTTASNGATVTLTWAAPVGGCGATTYIVQAGSGSGLIDLANFNTGSTATSYVAAGVAPGTYFLRLRAANSSGQSGPSSETLAAVISVSFTGGYETDPKDGERPTRLIAAALGVTQEQFQLAFSGVTPSQGGIEPSPELAARNKAALMSVLGPLGVTNERLDQVSNYYRFQGSRGETWPRTPAAATAFATNGVLSGLTITTPGSGYSSTPGVVLQGLAGAAATATVSYTTGFATNGAVTALTIAR